MNKMNKYRFITRIDNNKIQCWIEDLLDTTTYFNHAFYTMFCETLEDAYDVLVNAGVDVTIEEWDNILLEIGFSEI